jgi:hypothetical protein
MGETNALQGTPSGDHDAPVSIMGIVAPPPSAAAAGLLALPKTEDTESL